MNKGDRIILENMSGEVISTGEETYTVSWDTGHVFSYHNSVDWLQGDPFARIEKMRIMTLDELSELAKDAQGKAAYEYWIREVLRSAWVTVSWDDLDEEKRHWVNMVQAGDDAFLETYRKFGDKVPLGEYITDAWEDYRKELGL